MDYAQARLNMIEGQVRPNKVINTRLIETMARLPRERFVPKRLKGFAYVDEDLALGGDRALMEPMVIARLLQAAEIDPTEVALVVGTASGYEAALAAGLAQTVLTVDTDAEQLKAVEDLAHELEIDNLATLQADNLPAGVPAQAPFDVILINGAVAETPTPLIEQLSEGGRLVGILRPPGRIGQATVWKKMHGVTAALTLFDASTPYLGGFQPVASFQF